MRVNYAVLPDPILRKSSVKCLSFEETNLKPYNENLCLLRPLGLYLHEKENLKEETSKLFNLLLEKNGGTDLEGIAVVENIFKLDILLYDIDVVERSMNGELARSSVGNNSNNVQLLR